MNVDKRIRFAKLGEARYISHLDLYRFMLRALKMAGLPVWHTEGFNPHIYVSFALPLSLGQCGECEIMDFRITEDIDNDVILKKLSSVMPNNIKMLSCSSPKDRAKDVESSDYRIVLYGGSNKWKSVKDFLFQDEIYVDKKSKSGNKLIDLKKYMKNISIKNKENDCIINVNLPTTPGMSINPSLIVDNLPSDIVDNIDRIDITRVMIYNKDGNRFI